MALNLQELRKKRGVYRRKLTLLQNFTQKFATDITPSSLQKEEIRQWVTLSEPLLAQYESVQDEIEFLTEGDEALGLEVSQREEFITKLMSTMATCNLLLQMNDTCEGFEDSSSTCTKKENHTNISKSRIKLPTIALPSFDGSYDSWLEFRDTYFSLIHTSLDLSEIQKFHYLRASLTGQAAQIIKSLEFSAKNYKTAWDLLESRYNNKRLLIHNHVKALFGITSVSKESSAQLRKLIDTVRKNLRSLDNLGEPTAYWDTLVIHILTSKLDPVTEREWEKEKGVLLESSDTNVTLEQLLKFLKERADLLEMIKVNSNIKSTPDNNTKQATAHSYVSNSSGTQNNNSEGQRSSGFQKRHHSHRSENMQRSSGHQYSCQMCNAKHPLYSCSEFLELPVIDRINLVTEKNICHNCLKKGHATAMCWYGPCKHCSKKHNSLLHTHSEQHTSNDDKVQSSSSFHTKHVEIIHNGLKPVLLSTALIEVLDCNNKSHIIRALLDNASQSNFISESLAQRLNTHRIQSTLKISGVGHTVTQATQACNIEIKSKAIQYSKRINAFVLPQITSNLLSVKINPDSIHIPEYINLADPDFYDPRDIDMLIGAEHFMEILSEGKIRLSCGPHLHNTKFGWIISGSLNLKGTQTIDKVTCNLTQTLNTQLQKFWELEEVQKLDNLYTQDEQACEDLFVDSTQRDEHGRFSVRIPLKEPAEALGETFTLAEHRFYALERKLERSIKFKELYSDFLKEYETLGHMTKVDSYSQNHYFLPHHGVLREHSSTTKLRVVFDASCSSSSGKSLNDIQHTGPTLQNDIFSILLRFRQHQFVACADIEKCYRQTNIQKDQRDLQLILWREKHTDPLSIYRLNTITYGTASAPFLSLRCIRQLALDCDNEVVARVIKEDFYVDDLCTSHENKQTLLDICDEVAKVLNSGCFPLRKWVFNTQIEGDDNSTKELNLGEQCLSRTLGLGWFYNSDEIHFTSEVDKVTFPITKRKILSIIAQIYDPLGLLSPVIVKAKSLMQRLWLAKIDWDGQVPEDIAQSWVMFLDSLSSLGSLRIPRHIKNSHAENLELHIFTDSSQSAYGACAYVRSCSDDGSQVVRLLCAKCKVAPVKTVSIPRLELCGALLGARLSDKIIRSLHLKFKRVCFWTDSTIVMGWIRTSPSLLKTFVQNRVSEINELTGSALWMHVSGKENPADILSRGLSFDQLKDSALWWNGPSFLHESNADWSQEHANVEVSIPNSLPEVKSHINCMAIETDVSSFPFDRFSTLLRLKRTTAYILRFIFNARTKNKTERKTGPLTADELDSAVLLLARKSQQETFAHEHTLLQSNLSKKMPRNLSGLNSFIDTHDIIRVGGRLGNSNLPYDKKHPILLNSNHKFTQMLFQHEHKQLLHAGPQLLLSHIRESWWPLGGRNLAKKVVHQCVRCVRLKGVTPSPIMGNLPEGRLQSNFPFLRCGVDYAGPLLMLNRRGRGAKLEKCYVCLFVCFSTKAIHLELVSSLSSHDYLLALKRFMSRRGKPAEIFSDNGRTFVGAMKEVSSFLQTNSHTIIDRLANDSIKFTFIPPYASHFGGLWEAGVKSCKHHLRRVMGNAHFNYEELSTVLAQIEAVLNSRPITPLSSDPDDLLPLTPAHFLIGRSLTAPPAQDITQIPSQRLPRYDRVEQARQHFWQRWYKEYLSELQIRTKWQQHKDDLVVGELVLIKEDNLPPLQWRLGRVLQTHPGADGINRVADIKTTTGITRRAFSKICPLHQSPEEQT